MRWMNKFQINQKIFGAIMVSLLFLASILGYIIWESLTNMMADELKKRGLNIANTIAASSSDYILTDDYYATYFLISQAQQANEDVRYILVINNNHGLVSHTFSGDLPKGIMDTHMLYKHGQPHVETLVSNEGLIHDVLFPIEDGDIGFVRVGMTEKQAKADIKNKIGKLIIATILVCVGAAGIAYCVTRIITRPINNLVRVASGISAGKLSLRAHVSSNDEIGRLAQAFNEMADNLISSNKEVEALLNELQDKDRVRDTLILKLISAQEDERKRISRELHDETSQALTSLIVTMRVMANEAKDAEQQELLTTSRDIAAGILREIRDLAVELRPPILDDMGLIAAMRKYANKFEEKYAIEVHLTVPNDDIVIESHTAVALYRILQESLTNVVKHTAATRIDVRMEALQQAINVTIRDNGHGIEQEDFEQARRQNRIGIHGMRERSLLLGGTFLLEKSDWGGTELKVSIPLKCETE
ncbi:HAMP domain-containing sensor histidine kinase [Paenibacillus sp. 481]|uniref:HAMP domain-containing sensor histidine kinase n=1 Tax=Paenibacillus sp. 481 TaxID=2835869 RepID=UPI001E2DE037|nr:HAMP domain-containing protein [Paenibacillus sp. 481]UHA72513.1 HAMP domain-containing protein [Paenibacillus sp. 481]